MALAMAKAMANEEEEEEEEDRKRSTSRENLHTYTDHGQHHPHHVIIAGILPSQLPPHHPFCHVVCHVICLFICLNCMPFFSLLLLTIFGCFTLTTLSLSLSLLATHAFNPILIYRVLCLLAISTYAWTLS